MKKYSRQIKDEVSKELQKAPERMCDIVKENHMLDMLCGYEAWPKSWMSVKFNPCDDLAHTMLVLQHVFPNEKWDLKCVEPNVIYETWVKSEEYAVHADRPARSLMLGIWNAWRLEHDGESE